MALAVGTRVGSYEVVATLGAGGMGEVYRARDTKLHRDVALKLLPEALARDPDRLARLTREAQVLAALNHPHIAQIYGFEDSGDTHALVMELVEGPTLADVISSRAAAGGSLPLPDALHVAREIADALEAAHERGIIHRDLKPANVALQSADGATDIQSCRIKVLDFGLAKAVDASGATPWSPSDSPTKTSPALTEMGVILGTATYMSPEQARGRAVDRRADIWAFGVVLFEMLGGQPPFRGEDVSDTLANVLKREPDWDALPADVPARVRQVLRACLQKSMKARLADMQDVRLALDGAFETPAPAAAHTGPPRRRKAWMIAAAAGAIAGAVIAAAGVSWWAARAPEGGPASRLSFVPPSSRAITFPGRPGRSIALSPDGTEIVYVALARDAGTPASRLQLELRTLNSRAVTDLPGTQGGTQPFFSPDGRWVAFFTGDGNLKKVSVAGGNPVTLGSGINDARWSFGVWLPDESIVFGAAPGLMRVPADGGTLSTILSADAAKNERDFTALTAVPSGRAVLFAVGYGALRRSRVDVLRLDTGERLPVLDNAAGPLVVAGHLLFWRGDAPLVVPFDEKTLKVTGPARPLVDAVALDSPDSLAPIPQWAASATGALVYVPATDTTNELGLVARDGTFQSMGLPHGRYDTPRVSPDGRTLAFTVQTPLQSIGFFDFDRRSVTKLASAGDAGLLAWNPDGRSLAVRSLNENAAGIGIADLEGRTRTFIPDPAASTFRRNASWSPDGKLLAFTEQTSTGENIWAMSIDNPSSPKPIIGGADAFGPAFSPDGRWLAYASAESGRREVYVRRYPDGQRYAVSTSGGVGPVWNRNGKEIFFQSLGQGQTQGVSLMAVAVTSEGETLRLGQPVRLFDLRVATADGVIAQYVASTNSATRYDVMPDGQHFVMVRGAVDTASNEIVVVPHWLDELRTAAP